MRRVVRDQIAAANRRSRPQLERFMAGHLECPATVPLAFTRPVASIQEIRELRVTPRFRADYPPVDVVVEMRVLCNRFLAFRPSSIRHKPRPPAIVVGGPTCVEE